MTKYLNTKPGSIEELAAKMTSQVSESEYQQKFKKELEKAGKGIGAMTPAEKKAFFSKIDKQHKAKDEEIKEAVDNPYAVGMAQAMKATGDKPPLKKSTITKAHDIAKSIKKDEKKEEVKEEKIECPKCEGKGCEHCDMKGYHIKEAKVDELTAAQKKLPPALQKAIKKKEDAKEEVEETHTYHKDKQNQKQKDAKGEKDIVDPDPKLKTESDAYDNDRFEIRNGIAYIDNKNTPDNKNHVYAPDKKTAVQLFKQGKKVHREEANPSMNEETSKRFSLMKSIYDVWSNSATELEEVKKNAKYMKSSKDDVSTEVDAEQKKKEEEKKSKENEVDRLKDQVTLLKQKLENEKHKAVKPEPNPETGEVPLTVGVAYKIMKDKMKKESDEKEQNKNKTMTDKAKTPVDTKPSVDYKH